MLVRRAALSLLLGLLGLLCPVVGWAQTSELAVAALDPCLLSLPDPGDDLPGDESTLRYRLAEREATAALASLCSAQVRRQSISDPRDERYQDLLRHGALRLYAAAALYRDLTTAPRASALSAPALASLSLLLRLSGQHSDAALSDQRLRSEHPRSPQLAFLALLQGDVAASIRLSYPALRPSLSDEGEAALRPCPLLGYALLLTGQARLLAGDVRGAQAALTEALSRHAQPPRPEAPVDRRLSERSAALLVEAALRATPPLPEEASALLFRAGEARAPALLLLLAEAYSAAGLGSAALQVLGGVAQSTVDPAAAAPLWLRLGEALAQSPAPLDGSSDTSACQAAAAFQQALRRAPPAQRSAARAGLLRVEGRCPSRPAAATDAPPGR